MLLLLLLLFLHLVQVQCGAIRSGEPFSCVVERRAGGLGGQGQGGAGLAGGHWDYPAHTGGAGEGAGSVLPLPAYSSWGRVSGHSMSQGRHLIYTPIIYDSFLVKTLPNAFFKSLSHYHSTCSLKYLSNPFPVPCI